MQQIQWDKMNWEIRHSTHYAKKLDMQGLIPPVSVASAWNQLFLKPIIFVGDSRY